MRFTALAAGFTAFLLSSTALVAAPLVTDLSGYQAVDGLTAEAADDQVTLTWQGAGDETLRLVLANDGGVPMINELAIQKGDGDWVVVAENARFEYRVTEGLRRMSNQQVSPLEELGVELTEALVGEEKWKAFADAPLDLRPVGEEGISGNNPPPAEGLPGQPGLPRNPGEISEADLTVSTEEATVTSNGGSIRVVFSGATMGNFTGDFVVTVFKGTNLIQTTVEASTDRDGIAYKYEAGIRGLKAEGDGVAVSWNDNARLPHTFTLAEDRPVSDDISLVRAANRVIAADTGEGSIAAFPPPHIWFWARQLEVNMGNNYYRKDEDGAAIGIAQSDTEHEDYLNNWSLYNAIPGTTQIMRAYFLPTLGENTDAMAEVMKFTNGDVMPKLDDHYALAAHFHWNAATQWQDEGIDWRIDDADAMRSAGFQIVSLSERPRDENQLRDQSVAFDGVRRMSDQDFLMMANMERSDMLGGHWDIYFSGPTQYVMLSEPRGADQPLVEEDPEYGKVYYIGSPEDMVEMIEAENAIIYMPHARTKGSSGYPDAVKDSPQFLSDNYRGAGFRWGAGSNLANPRLGDDRNLPLLDDMNNWAAESGIRPKFLGIAADTYWKNPGDDTYAGVPGMFLRLPEGLPTDGDYSTIVDAMNNGDYFVSTGEVLLGETAVEGSGADSVFKAEVQWTFPLDFVEVVWGNGTETFVEEVDVTDLGAFGEHTFEIPVDLSTAKWVRFAAWDVAGNGGFNNPVALDGR